MKIMHVTIQVKSLEDSIRFYREIAGMTIQRDMRHNGNMPIVFMADGADEVCIELIENPDASYKGIGISIGLHTEDVEMLHEELKNKGLEPTDMISPNPHVKFFFVKDPDGVSVQFI